MKAKTKLGTEKFPTHSHDINNYAHLSDMVDELRDENCRAREEIAYLVNRLRTAEADCAAWKKLADIAIRALEDLG